MKKYLPALALIFCLSVNVSGQIDFRNVTSQLPSKKTSFVAVEIGDVTNDGLNDIVVGSGYYFDDIYDYNIFIYKQNKNGTLADPIKMPYPKSYPGLRDIELGDFNNDKLTDIAICYGSTLGIYYQLATGGFSPIDTYTGLYYYNGIKSGDLNNDGLTDIVGFDSNMYKVFLQKPTGGFTLTTGISSKTLNCTQMEVGDLNGDHLNDIAKISGSNIEIIYQKNGVTITKDSSLIIKNTVGNLSSFEGITLGDLNGDGRNDIAVVYGGNSGRQNIYYQTYEGKIDTTNVKKINTYDIPTPIKITDLNCDGINEIILGHSGWNNISVFSKTTSLDYSNYQLFPALYYFTPFSMAVGDVNNDQKPDIVSVGQNASLTVLYNNSKPLTFDSIVHKIVFQPLKRDTTDTQTIKYIAINDTSHFCKKNNSIKQLIVQTYANEYYSGDSLSIRHGMLCSVFCDTIKTAFAFKKSYLLKTTTTESIVKFDTLTTTTTTLYSGSNKYVQSISLNSNICWNVSVDADWVKPEVYSGVGKKDLSFVIEQNLKASSRTANITISGDSVTPIIIYVYQYAAAPYVSSPTSMIVLSEKVNNMAYLEINSNTSWSISKDVVWLSFNKTMGTDNDVITIQGVQNETNTDRIGNVSFMSKGNVLKKVSVLQLKKAPNAIENPSDSEFKIYPNPLHDKLIIESDLLTDKTRIQICDLNGIVRWSENLNGLKSEIDLSWLQQGIYFVKIKSNTKNHVQTIIKQ